MGSLPWIQTTKALHFYLQGLFIFQIVLVDWNDFCKSFFVQFKKRLTFQVNQKTVIVTENTAQSFVGSFTSLVNLFCFA
jgi:hypothetical protein